MGVIMIMRMIMLCGSKIRKLVCDDKDQNQTAQAEVYTSIRYHAFFRYQTYHVHCGDDGHDDHGDVRRDTHYDLP